MKKISKMIVPFLLAVIIAIPVMAGDAKEIPAERQLPRLVDDANLLDPDDAASLLGKLNEISERQQCDVVVVTKYSLDGKSPMDYADDFYDYNGYGFGENADGILLLVSIGDRKWRISTCGFGITAFTDKGQEYISEKFLEDMSDGDYDDAFTIYAELCDKFLTQAKTGKPYDTGNMPDDLKPGNPFMILLAYILGLLPAFLVGNSKKKALKSVAPQYAADAYIGELNLNVNQDRFLYTNTTTRKIPHESGKSGGGSSTHRSSSGRSHGGSGGSF